MRRRSLENTVIVDGACGGRRRTSLEHRQPPQRLTGSSTCSPRRRGSLSPGIFSALIECPGPFRGALSLSSCPPSGLELPHVVSATRESLGATRNFVHL